MFALVDCNNFYVSCERAFNPRLEKIPVVVLSNNDGCIISRSNEAKKLGIPMGAPFFKWKKFCDQHRVQAFSSNYELYGDMSQRVMTILKEQYEQMEIYSIDEAFLCVPDNVSFKEMFNLRQLIKKTTGIPISIGTGVTKTLAKAANYLAKNTTDTGIFLWHENDEQCLSLMPVEKIWGIGYQLSKRLREMGIINAYQLRLANAKAMRLHFNVTVEKTIRELQGVSCIGFETPQPRKQIISSRSFGKKLTALSELEEAVSHYTTIASVKLRQQQSVAGALYVFLQTSLFNQQQSAYSNGAMFTFPCPTADTRYLIRIAKKCLQQIYRKNYQYHKAGIILMDISSKHCEQYDLFSSSSNVKSEQLMAKIDKINELLGKKTVFFAAEGIHPRWVIRCDKRSPRYTTRWEDLPYVMLT